MLEKRVKRSIIKDMDLMLQIQPGDYIVHIDHGIGIFDCIIEKEIRAIKKEYIKLLYKNNDIIFVPITEVGRLSKYIGVDTPKLTPLSSKKWKNKLKKLQKDTEKIAKELLLIYAKRKIQKGYAFGIFRKEEYIFQNSFEHSYTPDQIKIINEIFSDMEISKPMDRLICGDVGFGKTEIAFNAIFKAMLDKKQVAFICPLIVLAYEHFEKAKQRLKNFPFHIEIITRFSTPIQIKTILKKLEIGEIQLIIGTHRLLSEDINFKDLGLLVIDEEHKFGVQDKEKIKNFKGNIDILSLSATPIPRSLNMALNKIKDISILNTPPPGRLPIHTIVNNFSDKIIYNAGQKEFNRKGQIFFIHNRIETISHIQKYLTNLFPTKKTVVIHGQIPNENLEKNILDFKRKKYDILLSTNIIENGIDFSNVNTIFINNAENFGISQIHQLRGRVGRRKKQGYCYLLFKKNTIKEDAIKRLKTIVDYSQLGAGFELAIKDLEIRGGGDILGIKQSGTSLEVGVNLFLQMLEHKVQELKNTQYQESGKSSDNSFFEKNNIHIDLHIDTFIDGNFFGSELDKLHFYREIESVHTIQDLEHIINDFKFHRPTLPKGTHNFFDVLRLKILAKQYEILIIKKVGIYYQIDFREKNKNQLDTLKKFLNLDTKVYFEIITPLRIRTKAKIFTNEENFLEYMLLLLLGKM